MKKILLFSLVVFIFVCCLSLAFDLKNSLAQDKFTQVSFSDVVPFFTAGGYLGFFDQKDGTLYLYDGQMKECVSKYRLHELGRPAHKLK